MWSNLEIALTLLRDILLYPDGPCFRLQEGKLYRGDTLIPHQKHSIPDQSAAPRVGYLLGAIGLTGIDLEDLGAGWTIALTRQRPQSSQELIEIGERVGLSFDRGAEPLGTWRKAVCVLLGQSDELRRATAVAGLDTSHPIDTRHPQLRSLLGAWPNQILEHYNWRHAEPPLPDMPPLAIDDLAFYFRIGRLNKANEPGNEFHLPKGEPIEFVLDRMKRLLILIGPRASGKTTLLKSIARRLITQPNGRFLLPLFASLSNYIQWKNDNPAADLLDFILDRCAVRHPQQRQIWSCLLRAPEAAIRQSVLLLLDDWDQVAKKYQETLAFELRDLRQSFSLVLTSRSDAFPESLSPHDTYCITAISPELAEEFIQQRLEAAGFSERSELLLEHLRLHPDICRCASDPFSLALLCHICGNSQDQRDVELPSSRTGLYDKALGRILTHHNNRSPEAIFDKRRRCQVEELALKLLMRHCDTPRFIFNLQDIVACRGDHDLLESYLKPSGLVIWRKPAGDYFQFRHPRFHFFLAACALSRESAPVIGRLLRLYADNPIWQEVFLFLAGHIETDRRAFRQEASRIARTPDRFGLIFLKLARFAAAAGATDGGEDLLGFDLRPRLWRSIEEISPGDRFAEAYYDLDPIALSKQVLDKLPKAELAVRTRLAIVLDWLENPPAPRQPLGIIPKAHDELAEGSPYQVNAKSNRIWRKELRDAVRNSALDEEARRRSIIALGRTRDIASVSRLVNIAKLEVKYRHEIIETLGRIRGRAATRALEKMLSWRNTYDWQARVLAALRKIRVVAVRDRLILELALRSSDDPLILLILEQLDDMPVFKGADIVASFLRADHTWKIGCAAARALRHSVDSESIGTLAETARSHPDYRVRIAALDAFGGHAKASDAVWLIGRIQDPQYSQAERARALRTLLMTAKRFSATFKDAQLRIYACEQVEFALGHQRGELALEAAALAYIAGESIGRKLIEICEARHSDIGVLELACRALGYLRFKPASSTLLQLVRQESGKCDDSDKARINSRLAVAAAEALTWIDINLLLDESGSTSSQALAKFALERQLLIFRHHIVDSRGRLYANTLSIRTRSEDRIPEPAETFPGADLTLYIRTERIRGHDLLAFQLCTRDPEPGIDTEEEELVPLALNPRDYVRELFQDIESFSPRSKDEGKITDIKLAAKGATLFELLPIRIRQKLWYLKDQEKTLQIQSEEAYIPWELVKMQALSEDQKGPYLCDAYSLTRWLPNVRSVLHLPLSNIALLIPPCDDLARQAEERDCILSLAGSERKVIEIIPCFLDVIQALDLGEYDGWHFVGHGQIPKAADPNHWGLSLDNFETLKPEHLADIGKNLARKRPLIFLNGCHTGRGGMSLTGASGWSWRFIEAGAGAFIGTQWAVPDSSAKVFAKIFYREFCSGFTIAKAIRRARTYLRTRYPGDPTWLAYTVFANPVALCATDNNYRIS